MDGVANMRDLILVFVGGFFWVILTRGGLWGWTSFYLLWLEGILLRGVPAVQEMQHGNLEGNQDQILCEEGNDPGADV